MQQLRSLMYSNLQEHTHSTGYTYNATFTPVPMNIKGTWLRGERKTKQKLLAESREVTIGIRTAKFNHRNHGVGDGSVCGLGEKGRGV